MVDRGFIPLGVLVRRSRVLYFIGLAMGFAGLLTAGAAGWQVLEAHHLSMFLGQLLAAGGVMAGVGVAISIFLGGAVRRIELRSRYPGQDPVELQLRGLFGRVVAVSLPPLILTVVVADAIWRNPTDAAALGTVSAIGYVAYQSWHTRRAADAAVRGLVTAERALRVSQAMAAEAEKARLDQRAPAVRVSIGDPSWPPCGPRRFVGSEAAQLPAGHIYRLPKNASDRLGSWAEGQVCNEGSATFDIELRGLRVYDYPFAGVTPRDPDPDDMVLSDPGTFRRSLPPGGTIRFRLQGDCPVSDWIANHRASEHNRTSHGTVDDPGLPLVAVIRGEVVVDDGDDNGVVDSWSLSLSGEPLEPVPDEAESWQIPKLSSGGVPISATVGRRRRTYWRSKERGLELPTPEV